MGKTVEAIDAAIAKLEASKTTVAKTEKTNAGASKLETKLESYAAVKSIVKEMGGKANAALEIVDGKLKVTCRKASGSGGTKSPSPLKAIGAIDVRVNGKSIESTSLSRIMAAILKVDAKDAKSKIYGKDSPVRVARKPEWIARFKTNKVTVDLPDGKSKPLVDILA